MQPLYCADYIINNRLGWRAYNVTDRGGCSLRPTRQWPTGFCIYAYIPVWPPAASTPSSWCSACCALHMGRSPTQNWNATCMRMQRTRRIMDANNCLEARNLPFFYGSSRQKRVLISSTEVSQSLWRRHWQWRNSRINMFTHCVLGFYTKLLTPFLKETYFRLKTTTKLRTQSQRYCTVVEG